MFGRLQQHGQHRHRDYTNGQSGIGRGLRRLERRLRGHLDTLRDLFTPEREAAAVRALVEDALR